MSDTFRAAFPSHNEVLVNQKVLSRASDIEQRLRDLIEIIEVHGTESLNHDSSGKTHCNCLKNAVNRAKKQLAE